MTIQPRRQTHRRRPHVQRSLQHGHEISAPEAAPVHETLSSTPMRTLTLIYHEDFEEDIVNIIARHMLVARYTKVRDVIGARTDGMRRDEYQADLGKNNMLYIVAERDIIRQLTYEFHNLRQQKGHGLRGYVTPVEDII